MQVRQSNRLDFRSRPIQQSGFSLIELIIAIALGIFLVLGVVQIYIDSKNSYRIQDSLARMQENARFAIDIFARDFRQAGYIGCSSASESDVNTPTGLPNFSPEYSIVAYQSTSATAWAPAIPTNLQPANAAITGNSDIVSINSAGICAAAIKTDTVIGDPIAIESGVCDFAANDIVVVSDCGGADIVKLNTVSAGSSAASATVTPATDLSRVYEVSEDAEVIRAKSRFYYVAKLNDANSPSLYMKDTMTGAAPVALLDGVESLQLTFGEDTNNNGVPNSFLNANDVSDWRQVISVKISLLLRSAVGVGAGTFTYSEGGTTVVYEDGILRKSFNSTVRLRNRGLK